MTRHGAYHKLLKIGPWLTGSVHGYHPKGSEDCDKHPNEEWRHVDNGKYGQGYRHCHFCNEDVPFHSEYCAWYDFFVAWEAINPMEVDYSQDKNIVPMGCRASIHAIEE